MPECPLGDKVPDVFPHPDQDIGIWQILLQGCPGAGLWLIPNTAGPGVSPPAPRLRVHLQREAWRPLQGFLQCWRKILAPVGCQHSCLCFPEHSSAPKTQGRPGKEGGCPAHTKAGTCRNPRVQDFGGVIVLHGGG